MVRLSDLHPAAAKHLAELELPAYDPVALAPAPPLPQARVAIISTAGLHRAADRPFTPGAADYRIIPGDVDAADLRMSHVSVNFDRSGFQQDVNVAFPIERLRELATAGEIGSVAAWHYSFMGATDPQRLDAAAAEMSKLLRDDGVTAALLVPV